MHTFTNMLLDCLSSPCNTAGVPFISRPITLTDVDISYHLSPVFDLTCVSHNGPATTVTWTRDQHTVFIDANHILSQRVTNMIHGTYENVLTVKGSEPGRYQCCVANDRGRDCSLMFIMTGKVLFNTCSPVMPALLYFCIRVV